MLERSKKAGFQLKDENDYYNNWDEAKATFNEEEGTLEICGTPVMESWQADYIAGPGWRGGRRGRART